MIRRSAIVGAAVALTTLFAQPVMAKTKCDIDRPIIFAEHGWDSSGFQAQLARYILDKGYGCKTDSIPGTTVPLLAGMVRGDIDVTMEIWPENTKVAWEKGLADGTLAEVGVAFPDSSQGWYVPRYLVEGENAKAPNLKSVFDLPKYKELFRDPEEPGKGRFYNGPAGWGAEKQTTKKLIAYGLDKDFVNFRAGTGAALASVFASNYRRKKAFVAYYWSPTWVMGKYDMVKLVEPKFDAKIWADLNAAKAKDVTNATKATAWPVAPVLIGVNAKFGKSAPVVIDFLSKYGVSAQDISNALSYMQDTKGATRLDAAKQFLKTQENIWTKWVPQDAATKIKASLVK